ncbi:MAG: aldo/keto reductase [Nocardioidaceae bacterium]
MDELELGPLGLGTANLGNLFHAISDEEAWRILETAWECGIRYYDTAPHYGLGLAERRLGAFLATKPREEFVVSTKVGRLLRPDARGALRTDDVNDFVVPSDLARVWDFRPDGIRQCLEESLDRLGLDRVDIAYLHDPERYDLRRGVDEALPALAKLRAEKVVRAVGVGSMVGDALLTAARTGVPDLLMVAGRLTLADQTGNVLLPVCSEHGIGLVGAAVFNSGLLVDPSPSETSLFDYEPVSWEVLMRTRRIAAVCARYDVPLATAALQYPLRLPGVRSVVAGGATPEQVRQNALGARVEVPDGLWQRLLDEDLVAL